MKTLIVGRRGFIGRHFYRHFRSLYPDTIGTSSKEGPYWLDLFDPKIDFSVEGYKYAVLCADVGKCPECESNYAGTAKGNVEGLFLVAKQLLDRGVIPILLSTSYVFDGKKEIYLPDSPTCPINAYGRQHAELEEKISKLPEYLIVRLSRVYSTDPLDNTLFDQMIELLKKGETLHLSRSQRLFPLHVGDVIQGVSQLQHEGAKGVYHLSGQERETRFEIGQLLAERLGVSTERIQSYHSSDHIARALNNYLGSFLEPRLWKEMYLEAHV